MIPYPHDTTEEIPASEPVIEPSVFLDRQRPTPRRGFVLGAFLVAMCLHGYALAVLPGAMEIEVEPEQTAELNLENDDIGGNDPTISTNYNVTRIESLAISCPVNPADSDPDTGKLSSVRE
jgi:hypothetical protein